MHPRPRVVIVGSGFGGLSAARSLAGRAVDVTVVDRDNYHGFWPLLYQVATAGLGVDDIARPIRAMYAGHDNIDVRVGTVSSVDLDRRLVEVDGETALEYDYLILATGSSTADFGIPGVAEHAFPLKTLPDAVRLRNHILRMFERADASRGDPGAAGDLSVVLVGGGPTGVELAGALSELISHNLAADFKYLDLTRARIVLVEMTDHILAGFSPASQQRAYQTLRSKGVEVRLNTKLAKLTEDTVSFEDGTEMHSGTVVWTAGVRANPLAGSLPGHTGKGGTLAARADLSLPGHQEVFVIGDVAAVTGPGGEQLPMLAQVAIQGGKRSAANIMRLVCGKPTRRFRYRNRGVMATIGRRSAVAELPGGLKLGGTLGWASWLAVHLVFLIGFRNRLVVMVNWAWNYLTWDRASRVILGEGSSTPTGQHRA